MHHHAYPSAVPSVLIAGCGYVGTALAALLSPSSHTRVRPKEAVSASQAARVGEAPYNICAIRRSRSAKEVEGVTYLYQDLLDKDGLAASLPSTLDYVFFLASPDRREAAAYASSYLEAPAALTGALAARRMNLQRFFFITSTAVYHQDDGSWVDESSETAPTTFSGQTLLKAEDRLRRSEVPTTVVRFSGIYGPSRTRLLHMALDDRASQPEQRRFTNRIHRDDCAGFLKHLMQVPQPLPLYVATDKQPTELHDVIGWLREQAGRAHEAISPLGEVHGKRCSNALMLNSGYSFRYPDFRAGYQPMLEDAIGRGVPTRS